jgi:hypothetical protein
MSILTKMRYSIIGLVVLLVLIAGLGVAEAVWISSWQSDYSRTLDQARAANQTMTATVSMGSSVAALSDAVGRGYGYADAVERFTADGTAAVTAIEEALAATKAGSAEVAVLEETKALLVQYQAAGAELFALAQTDPVNVPGKIAPIVELGAQAQEAAVTYQESTMAQLTAKLGRLGGFSTAAMIIMAVVGVLGVAWGLATILFLVRGLVRNLREATAGVSGSAAELLAVASQVAASAAQTAASANETTVTVEEVRQTAQLAHEKASSAAEGAQGAVHAIGSARTLTEEVTSSIERMHAQMDVVSEAIDQLSERAQTAGEIIASVNDLAEQSNLLSVNASIEAAKAGEHGKGFTVVAQEVKSLAEQSKQAVAQVRTMLGEIQKASQTAVQAAASGRESVEVGRQKSMEAGEVMQRVAEGAADDSQASIQVVASSQQQLAGMEQIAQAITSINEATAQAVSGTRQVEKEVKQLQDLAMSLKGLVEAKNASEAGRLS